MSDELPGSWPAEPVIETSITSPHRNVWFRDGWSYIICINSSQNSIDVFHLSGEPQWKFENESSKFHIFDISENEWILYYDEANKVLRVSNVYRSREYSLSESFTFGRFLSSSLTEVHCILKCGGSNSLKSYVAKVNDQGSQFIWEKTWIKGTNKNASGIEHDKDCSELDESIAVYNGNIMTIWHNRLRDCFALLLLDDSSFDLIPIDQYKDKYSFCQKLKYRSTFTIQDSAFCRMVSSPSAGALLELEDQD